MWAICSFEIENKRAESFADLPAESGSVALRLSEQLASARTPARASVKASHALHRDFKPCFTANSSFLQPVSIAQQKARKRPAPGDKQAGWHDSFVPHPKTRASWQRLSGKRTG